MERLVEADMLWLFHQADSNIGLKSNFPEQIRVQAKLAVDDYHQNYWLIYNE